VRRVWRLSPPASDAQVLSSNTPLTDWPHIISAIPKDAKIEAEVARILAGMTLAQKIGQMMQPSPTSESLRVRPGTQIHSRAPIWV
jgi:beta-glucosidase